MILYTIHARTNETEFPVVKTDGTDHPDFEVCTTQHAPATSLKSWEISEAIAQITEGIRDLEGMSTNYDEYVIRKNR